MSLPYHQAAIRDLEMVPASKLTDTGVGLLNGDRKFTRYGYADVLAENRKWDVVFRIWPGTQRFLHSGDPAIFAGYARNASFCGAAGIELSEPLHFKGRQGSGVAGNRCAYADRSLVPRYDFEKYLYTYRLWGRLGYNPDTHPEIWRRSLRRDFGAAAAAVENTLAPVSRILPLFTLAHAPSANCIMYWPEIYTNLPMADPGLTQLKWDTRQPALFGKVSPFDPQLFQWADECGDALVAGRSDGKYSPLEVAQWMEDIADAAATPIAAARGRIGAAASSPAYLRVEEDVLIQIGQARFFAGKLRSAVLWRIHTLTGDLAAGRAAIARYATARDAWSKMAERARSVYINNITYCSSGPRRLSGHWLDRIPAFDEDIADLRKRIETPLAPTKNVDPAAAERAVRIANAKPARPSVRAEHKPEVGFRSGQALAISLRCGAPSPHRVVLHYRHVDQAERWQAAELARKGEVFQGAIPADYTSKRYALQYYFQIETGPAEATLFPPLAAGLANVPYYVVRRAV